MARLPLRLIVVLALGLALPTSAEDLPGGVDMRPSVVKVEATIRQPNLAQPWTRPTSADVGGSGMVIAGKRILTNAHMVAYATQVTVQGGNASEKFAARVEAIATGIDLAVLALEDETFFDGKPAVAIAETLPKERDSVLVYGYPTGGSSVSVTKGIVSRVEYAAYDSDTYGLRGQIDAAINPGNSGGPVFADGKLLGVAFSRLGGADNIGYVIPAEEVVLFLEDIKDGRYDGKPALFDTLQTLENPALRKKLKLAPDAKGIVVHRPEPPRIGMDSPLKEWDLITRIGDHAVENTGLVRVADGLHLQFQYLVPKVVKDNKVPLTVLREGETLNLDVPVGTRRPRLLPTLRGAMPPYFIFGPIAFTAASAELVLGGEQAQRGWLAYLCSIGSPMAARLNDRPRFEGEQLVVIPCPFFSHRLVKGYSSGRYQTVREVNGIAIKNLRHLVETVRDAKEDLLMISFNEPYSETIILDRKAALAASDEILAENSIRKPCSDDLMPTWSQRKD